MSAASLLPVEKNGPDFHKLALPNRPKSPIRSIPKYGSGVVQLYDCVLEKVMRMEAEFRTATEAVSGSCLLPAGHYNTGLWIPQGIKHM